MNLARRPPRPSPPMLQAGPQYQGSVTDQRQRWINGPLGPVPPGPPAGLSTSVPGNLHQVIGMISEALLARGPIHDNRVGALHNVDDDADPCSVRLSHIIADFEAPHGIALVMLNSLISCIHSSGRPWTKGVGRVTVVGHGIRQRTHDQSALSSIDHDP